MILIGSYENKYLYEMLFKRCLELASRPLQACRGRIAGLVEVGAVLDMYAYWL